VGKSAQRSAPNNLVLVSRRRTRLPPDWATGLAKVFGADEKTLKYELAKLVIQRVENFVLSPAHHDTWSEDKRSLVLREFEASLAEPKEIPDHADLNIFL
jgi:hypothetical protein